MTSPHPNPTRARALRQQVFQTGLMSALLDGVYDGDCTVEHLLSRGDFGVGTFNALDGEMIILDGTCYRLSSDGTVSPAAADEKSPFAVVTQFVAHSSRKLRGAHTRDQIAELLDNLTPSDNYLYAFRVRAEFAFVRTRTVAKQSRPYRRLVDVTKGEPVHTFTAKPGDAPLAGDVVGFLTPVYQRGIGIAGDHAHFISSPRDRGGHVLDYEIRHGVLEVCMATDLHLELPLTLEFQEADLDDDPVESAREVSATENHS